MTTEYRCPAPQKASRVCNRLLGIGEAANLETVCPKCGAKLALKDGMIILKSPGKKNRR